MKIDFHIWLASLYLMRYILINRPEKKTDRGKRNDNEPVARDDEAADIVKCNRLQKERERERASEREGGGKGGGRGEIENEGRNSLLC